MNIDKLKGIERMMSGTLYEKIADNIELIESLKSDGYKLKDIANCFDMTPSQFYRALQRARLRQGNQEEHRSCEIDPSHSTVDSVVVLPRADDLGSRDKIPCSSQSINERDHAAVESKQERKRRMEAKLRQSGCHDKFDYGV